MVEEDRSPPSKRAIPVMAQPTPGNAHVTNHHYNCHVIQPHLAAHSSMMSLWGTSDAAVTHCDNESVCIMKGDIAPSMLLNSSINISLF